ncbi:FadR family transcriptional regulator [Sphingomonas koreensis]|nr:FadR family transcriptional regulator [Sphingomonas koreensis]
MATDQFAAGPFQPRQIACEAVNQRPIIVGPTGRINCRGTEKVAGRGRLYQQVALAITEAIGAGRYPVGSRLPGERELADEFKVSRPVIREAMIAMEIRGLVEGRQGSGLYVTAARAAGDDSLELDIGPFELTEARILCEGEAVALAATTISDAKLAVLEALLIDMNDDDEKSGEAERADRQFHIEIANATGNDAIRAVVEMLWDTRYRSPLCIHMFSQARAVGVLSRVEEHEEILTALRNRDGVTARKAMHAHLQRVIDDLLTATEQEAFRRVKQESERRRSDIARRFSSVAE